MYDKIYTLMAPFTDNLHAVLNGHIFSIKLDDNLMVHFVDRITEQELLVATPIISKSEDAKSLKFTTESGQKYELHRLSAILPTMLGVAREVPALPKVVNKVKGSEPYRAYSDHVRFINYTFAEEITEEQFLAVLKADNVEVKPKGAWYEDYSTISGKGKEWTWKWIQPSTH